MAVVFTAGACGGLCSPYSLVYPERQSHWEGAVVAPILQWSKRRLTKVQDLISSRTVSEAKLTLAPGQAGSCAVHALNLCAVRPITPAETPQGLYCHPASVSPRPVPLLA